MTATARAERRLAAIMAADVVGYSRLVEADEAGTLAAIGDLRREAIDPRVALDDKVRSGIVLHPPSVVFGRRTRSKMALAVILEDDPSEISR